MESLGSFYYKKYKTHVIPLVLFVLGIFIVLRVAVPQFSAVQEIQHKIGAGEEKLKKLKATFSLIQNEPQEKISSDLSVVKRALPTSKEIITIYLAMSGAAAKTNVAIKGFALKVGDIYQKAGKGQKTASSESRGSNSIAVELSIASPNPRNTFEFASLLYKTLPITEVKKIEGTGGDVKLNLSFFYKAPDLSALAATEYVEPLTFSQERTLKDMKEWGK